jgi:hypothetical protein
MHEMRKHLLAECEQDFVSLKRVRVFGDEVTLYGRPPVRCTGADADHSITSDGLRIEASGTDLHRFPRIELRGRASEDLHGAVLSVRADLQSNGKSERTVPSALFATGTEYSITVDLNPDEIPEQGPVAVNLTFDFAFKTPNEPRHPVMKALDHIRLLRLP